MRISASVRNAGARHDVRVSSGDGEQSLAVSAKSSGGGSAVNGGEFLMLALATCYCNDLYREAARLGVPIAGVDVVASADFDGIGLAATNITYSAKVTTDAPDDLVAELLRQTDAVAEIHNTVRSGVAVTLVNAA
jgi:organic hydroperoxide reductase OsmC/OhrA